MQTFEYGLDLSTGEKIWITEIAIGALDKQTLTAFKIPELDLVLMHCTKVPRSDMDDAKIGYTKPLERLLRTPPVGILMKFARPVCENISTCAMANPKKCTVRYRAPREKPEAIASFPECWDFDARLSKTTPIEIETTVREIANYIVAAWRWSRYVIISE